MPEIKDIEAVKQKLRKQGVNYMMPAYVDIHGISKTKVVPTEHLERMAGGSELFTGAALDGVPQDVSDEEVAAAPDLDSVIILPWNKEVAWFASDLYLHEKPFSACSRRILKAALNEAKDMGYQFNFGIEVEFYLLKDIEGGGFAPIGPRDELAKPAYDVKSTLDSYTVLEEIVRAMNGLGWDVYSYDHEDGNGQFEIDFMYADGLTMADRFIFFRLMANEIAHRHGYFASFMPKPFADRAGSGAHYNMSLANNETGGNLFENTADPRGCGLSALGYYFIGGILKHMPAISAVVSPTINSYKRLIKSGSMSGFTWAPIYQCYGNNNRTNTLRIPKGGGRVECRAADISCNPYLGAALTLAAGLEGVREKIEPGEPHNDNMYLKSRQELAEMGVKHLPKTLLEAVDALAEDELAKKVFGDLMHKTYVDFKRAEWESYINHVSDWEVKQYLKFF